MHNAELNYNMAVRIKKKQGSDEEFAPFNKDDVWFVGKADVSLVGRGVVCTLLYSVTLPTKPWTSPKPNHDYTINAQ